jgi:glycine dehydrogenase
MTSTLSVPPSASGPAAGVPWAPDPDLPGPGDRAGRVDLGDPARGFADRHIGPDDEQLAAMLTRVGYSSLEELVAAAMPEVIRRAGSATLPAPAGEAEALGELRAYAADNRPATQTPGVILRNVLENPAWYTAYTPYQPEISQGRLEALLTFQTVVEDLTGLPVANASLLDEATAAAEAMTLMRRVSKAPPDAALVLDSDLLPQTRAVVETRAEPLGLRVVVADVTTDPAAALDAAGPVFGVIVQFPGTSGLVTDLEPVAAAAHERGALLTAAADLLALTLLRPPGESGADVAVGTSQRFGVPLGYGGPHAGYLAVRRGLERSLPGRLVGVSRDANGAPAYRLALQTREQHIRREKATSNICTAQVLLAVMAAMYAVHHGPAGLRDIAERGATGGRDRRPARGDLRHRRGQGSGPRRVRRPRRSSRRDPAAPRGRRPRGHQL